MTDDKKDKGDVTSEEFDEAIETLLDEMTRAEILATPGVYEAFLEALNNKAIALARETKEKKKEEEEDDDKET